MPYSNKKDKKIYDVLYYKRNRKEILKQKKQYRKDNPEKIKDIQKRSRQRHCDKRNEYSKRYYETNREKMLEQSRQWYKERNKWIQNYKLSKGCAICGYNKCAAALCFHHPNNDKEFNISQFFASGKSLEEISKEMNKCEILCFNCHQELHNKK